MARGSESRVISDMNEPWGASESCTSCGKCVRVCPTGALFGKQSPAGDLGRDRSFLTYLKTAREQKLWIR
jgi:bidirectional [NiFe] hydrogenase diaphorase subunit